MLEKFEHKTHSIVVCMHMFKPAELVKGLIVYSERCRTVGFVCVARNLEDWSTRILEPTGRLEPKSRIENFELVRRPTDIYMDLFDNADLVQGL